MMFDDKPTYWSNKMFALMMALQEQVQVFFTQKMCQPHGLLW